MSYIKDLLPTVGWVTSRMFVHDLNRDGMHEFIYFSQVANMTRIYSMNNTPYTPLSFTGELWTPPDGGDGDDDDGGGIPHAESDGSGVPPIFQNLNNPTILNFVFGIIVIIVSIMAASSIGITNPLLLVFVGILGTIISFTLGLLSIGFLVVILVSLVIMIMLALTIFKPGGQ